MCPIKKQLFNLFIFCSTAMLSFASTQLFAENIGVQNDEMAVRRGHTGSGGWHTGGDRFHGDYFRGGYGGRYDGMRRGDYFPDRYARQHDGGWNSKDYYRDKYDGWYGGGWYGGGYPYYVYEAGLSIGGLDVVTYPGYTYPYYNPWYYNQSYYYTDPDSTDSSTYYYYNTY